MEFSLASGELAGQKAVDEGQARGSPKFGSREFGERMKIDVVYRLRKWILHQARSVEHFPQL